MKTILTDFNEKVYIGLGDVRKKNLTKDELKHIEIALISYHKPRINAIGVKHYKGIPIRIKNNESGKTEYSIDLDKEIEF